MTKEELEKEAREKYHNHKIIDFQGFYNHHYYYLGYVEGTEPREKRIADLEAQLEREQKLNQCMSDNNEQLRELIKQMKCCFNCKHSRTEYEHCKTDKHEKWEIKEK